jgi:5-methylcytosine-specific restriction enzyme A
MPSAPRKPCCEPMCPMLVPRGTARCAPHAAAQAAEYERRRRLDWTRAIYATPEYRRLRLEVLADNPMCVGCGGIATQADHIVPIRENPRLALVRANLAPRCRRCHVRRTKAGNP